MNNHDLQQYICRETSVVIDVMKQINRNSVGLVYVVDCDNKLIGCLTDGDIRRHIIHAGDLRAMVCDVMNREPKYILIDGNDPKTEMISRDCLIDEKMEREKIYSVALVDKEMHVQDVVFSETYLRIRISDNESKKALSGTPAIVMAGGKGTRLYPYTRILPKPLIPIGDMPILERILDRLSSYGIEDIWLTVNYKKEMIKLYFAESSHSYRLHYIDEEKPLGTAGSISLIQEPFDRPVIITNCDILIDADYGKIMEHHVRSGNDLTVVSSLKNTVIPYGVLHAGKNGVITGMEEKPQLSHLINTGMYIINPEFMEWIPRDEVFHMTQLADLMIERGRRVGMYPISENAFLDMGEFEELKKMEERLKG